MRYAALIPILVASTALGGEVDVINVKATPSSSGWRFDVTLQHGDTGWDHYADAWRVVGPDGTVFGTRVLYHPHVEEQPFTRSLSGVEIPEGITSVLVEAHDSVHGWNGQKFAVTLTK